MASSNASQFPDAPETRLAYDGHKYTKEEFQEFYGKDRGARYFAIAGLTRDAAKLCSTSKGLAANTTTRDAAQLPAGSADALTVKVRLKPEDVIAIQNEEAQRGPPRSLHKLARATLDDISRKPTRETVDLDSCFPWMQYVAAHKQSAEIIGPACARRVYSRHQRPKSWWRATSGLVLLQDGWHCLSNSPRQQTQARRQAGLRPFTVTASLKAAILLRLLYSGKAVST